MVSSIVFAVVCIVQVIGFIMAFRKYKDFSEFIKFMVHYNLVVGITAFGLIAITVTVDLIAKKITNDLVSYFLLSASIFLVLSVFVILFLRFTKNKKQNPHS